MRLWKALEQGCGLIAAETAWQARLGEEFAWLRPYLRPLPELADIYAADTPAGGFSIYNVVSHGPDQHVAICPESGHRVQLATAQLVIYELNVGRLAAAIAAGLQLAAPETGRSNHEPILRLGDYRLQPGAYLPVYLTTVQLADEVWNVAANVAVQTDGPFLLVTWGRTLCQPRTSDLLQKRSAGLLTLDEALSLQPNASFQLTPAGERQLTAFRDRINAAQQTTIPQANMFRKQGDSWELAFAGQTVLVRDMRGLSYIAWAIKHQGRPVLAAECAAMEGPCHGSIGPSLDSQALRAYRARIADLQAQIAEADRDQDGTAKAQAASELDLLLAELRSATGLGGRGRQQTDAERIRKTVTNGIARALDRIRKLHPSLHRHLERFLERGHYVRYQPDCDIVWLT